MVAVKQTVSRAEADDEVYALFARKPPRGR
jgi:hypothetical protein